MREMFVPMLGFITAVIATLAMVLTAVFGPFKRLRLPVESVLGQSRGVLNLALFAPFLVSFLLMDVAWARPALLVSLVALVLAFICYQECDGQLKLHRKYTQPIPRKFLWRDRIGEGVIIGGTELTPNAAARVQAGATEQTILAEAEYDPEGSGRRIAVYQSRSGSSAGITASCCARC